MTGSSIVAFLTLLTLAFQTFVLRNQPPS
jgi:hypothetical protein